MEKYVALYVPEIFLLELDPHLSINPVYSDFVLNSKPTVIS